jgi:chromosomal replication initiator protein
MTKPLGLLQKEGGATSLLVAAPNAFAKDVLESRLRSVINEVLTAELGE